ncbi:hypothetical protein WICPIJ_001741 [Wickerhamomyces pijperi]|uniref:tRNA(adenine(34)) deaminase n=1 Tax=Wickerhamomyces pijperi TaxID=599730 RepID=A0A9P8QD67_WICPI|nr:hypothetical protein WICPIJ_001741 [Wickerhamomyces pijperi]
MTDTTTTPISSSPASHILEPKHHHFMKQALRLASHALHTNEVPVACVFVHSPTNSIVSYGMNSTNDSLSGVKHAEFRGIEEILSKTCSLPEFQTGGGKQPIEIFKEIELYVTVEPCVMCASALRQIGIKRVYFGCGNERFGGNGSVLKINDDPQVKDLFTGYVSYPGIYRKCAILLLREFYTRENGKAPEPRQKKNRVLKLDEFPEIKWKDYLTEEEFLRFYGLTNRESFQNNTDIIVPQADENEEADLFDTLMADPVQDISDIIEVSSQPLCLANKKQKLQL